MSEQTLNVQPSQISRRPTPQPTENGRLNNRAPLLVVGIGASAGGLEALERLFAAMPAETGLAFVVIQHLSPDFKSLTDELLARRTPIPIHRVEDGMEVERNAIYLLPPKKDMIIANGRLLLADKDPTQGLTLPIDHFFRSLAQEAGDKAAAIVLSGTGSDGSRGVREIHDAGGLVIVQSPETAKFDGMPNSVVKTGVADLTLSPEEMPAAMLRYVQHPVSRGASPVLPEAAVTGVQAIFRLLRDAYGIDFAHYKPETVGRRVERRLLLGHVPNIDEYAKRLADDPKELNALYKDLLIGVTRFFSSANPEVASPESDSQTPARPSILLVEDDADIRESLKTLLEIQGYPVRTVGDGPAALVAIADRAPDVALVDIGLPGFDGCELARRIRAEPSNARLRLIALTGYGQPADREATAAAGFNAHLTKPLKPADLYKSLEGE
jgi:chemotaxis response regulator CheB